MYSAPLAGHINLFAPQTYQTYQRTNGTGSIAVSGTFNQSGAHDVEARFNGGAWVTLASGVISGALFSGTLTGQGAGQGDLDVRLVDVPAVTATIENVGIGDVFGIIGQSNAMGYGINNQVYAGPPSATCFGNDYDWRGLVDPVDRNTLQVDAVSDDTIAAGSVWPLLATSIMAATGYPVAFVPCPKGGSSITQWQPGANHFDRSTLYGSVAYRLSVTGCKAILMWQGESDLAMARAQYNAYLDTVANSFYSDLGILLMPCKLQDCTAVDESNVNDAIGDAWADNPNVLTGPDLHGITTAPEDNYHLRTDAKLLSAANLWWAAIQAEFGW